MSPPRPPEIRFNTAPSTPSAGDDSGRDSDGGSWFYLSCSPASPSSCSEQDNEIVNMFEELMAMTKQRKVQMERLETRVEELGRVLRGLLAMLEAERGTE
jgi:hypothetical protein